jgi:prophage tail gpP-like protein
MEGLTTGFAKHYDAAVDYYLRRLTFSDDQRYTPGRAEKRATWRYKQGLYGSETVTFTVQGHSQNGLAFASNSRADVRSDKLAVNRVMYQSAVEYHQTEEGGGIRSTTTITLKKDKLWTA